MDHRVAVGVYPAGVKDEPGLIYVWQTEGVTPVLVACLDEVGVDGLDAYGQGATGGGLDGCEFGCLGDDVTDFLIEGGCGSEAGREPIPSREVLVQSSTYGIWKYRPR